MSDSDIAVPIAWSQVRVRTRRKNTTRIDFRFDSAYVRAAWMPGPAGKTAFRTRGHTRPQSETLLLQDQVQTQGITIHVSAWLVPGKEPGTYHMRVKILAPQVVRRTLHLTLHWGYRDYSAKLDAGEYAFEDITHADFSEDFANKPLPKFWLSIEHETGGTTGKYAKN